MMQITSAKRWVAALLAMLLAGMPMLSCAQTPTYEGPGWATPEAAVTYYLQGLQKQDLHQMISAFAIETYIDHYDLQTQLAYTNVYQFSSAPSIPNVNQFTRSLNVELQKSAVVERILYHMNAICLPSDDFNQYIVFGEETAKAEIETFTGKLALAYGGLDLDALNQLLFLPPENVSKVYGSQAHQGNIQKQMALSGADDIRSVVVLWKDSERLYALLCDTLQYGDVWYMKTGISNIASLAGLQYLTGGIVSIPLQDLSGSSLSTQPEEQAVYDAFLQGITVQP